jgi:hypothetical protein
MRGSLFACCASVELPTAMNTAKKIKPNIRALKTVAVASSLLPVFI